MNADEWQGIPARLKAAGFSVSYERVSYAQENPLWRANANRDGREWNTLGRDLESALVELERQTRDPAVDWREGMALKAGGVAMAEHSGAD